MLRAGVVFALERNVSAASFDEDRIGWDMTRHSFDGTLTYDDNLADWLCSGATVALKNSVLLMPAVAGRHGIFWNKLASESSDYELITKLELTPQVLADNKLDEQFALWITGQNYSSLFHEETIVGGADWESGMSKLGLTHLDNSPSFTGLMVGFSGLDTDGYDRPSITGMFKEEDTPAPKIPLREGAYVNGNTAFLDYHQSRSLTVRVRVKLPGALSVHVKFADERWIEILQLSADTQMPVSYVGFTGLSGSASSMKVEVLSMKMINYDTSKAGEILEGVEDSVLWAQALARDFHFINQQSQTEAISQLSALFGSMLKFLQESDSECRTLAVSLDDRVDALDARLQSMKLRAEAYNERTGSVDVGVLKSQLRTIHGLLSNERSSHETKMVEMQRAAETLKRSNTLEESRSKMKEAAAKFAALEAQVQHGTRQTAYLVILLVLAVMFFGFLFVNRMRYYEKHHYV
jgi:hypothetical protein